MELDLAALDADALPHALDDPGDAVHLARRVGGIAGDDVRRDDALPLALELLEHGSDRDDVALELQLRLRQAGGDADQLRQVQDRHPEVRPVVAFSFDCHASSERWQSGHGVTIASAPASIACSIGWISSPSAVSSRAWMIGKPQHLSFAG